MYCPHKRLAFVSVLIALIPLFVVCGEVNAEAPSRINLSGVYPHLTMWNQERECGTGAVVPWQGSLWAITYAPHRPNGSSDKLYEITADLTQHRYEGSVGGTPANRMIHKESNQLLIGPYLIDAEKTIRVIPPTEMYGRLTGNARHLSDPQNKVYYATMEEGLYEVDVNTLQVKCLIRDGHLEASADCPASELPGYHGKGLYSGQGRLVYSNNGTNDSRRLIDPTIPSGALAQWFGTGDWQLVRRNQFTEVSGPGGIEGNANAATDPVWSLGWDAKSLILALLEDGQWTYYRLPKGSHSYDGAHGWNTEWPRIREIGESDLLATMHGTFWRFPADFSSKRSSGIAPRSNYLKVIGDFCRWNDRVVFGCDDSAQSEFANTRGFKAPHAAPLQSNSNFWFIAPETLDQLGPAIGRGSVWLREDLHSDQLSDAYLFSGYDYRQLHLSHQSDFEVEFTLQVDKQGNGEWENLQTIRLPEKGTTEYRFDDEESGAWIRLLSRNDAKGVTAHFQYRNRDNRDTQNDSMFAGIASSDRPPTTIGVMRSLAYDRLGLVAQSVIPGSRESASSRYYEIGADMTLRPVDNPDAAAALVSAVRQPLASVSIDDASVLLIEDGKRYRLPKSDSLRPFEPDASKVTNQPHRSLVDYLQQNLATEATVSVSSTHLQYNAGNVIDGQLSDESRWIGRNDGPTWVELDLQQKQTIRSIWVVSGWKKETAFVARDFDVQIMRDGQWQTVQGGEIRDNRLVERELVFEPAIETQRMRIVSSTDDYLRIYEIALFDQVINVDRTNAIELGPPRLCREVATERDLLNVHGTFYELPSRNAQGVAKIRPIATHDLTIHDFCSHNGLLFFTGIDAQTKSDHLFRSADCKAAVWAGVVDDLWKLGKPRGIGGPWSQTQVDASEFSDPYLMTAYDHKTLSLTADKATTVTAQVDVDGTGLWNDWKQWQVTAGETIQYEFPEGFSAYWIRFQSSSAARCTAQLKYQ